MKNPLSVPGAMLVVLHRKKTSTDVLVFPVRGEEGSALPWAEPRAEATQWDLAESLCDETWANRVSRLYASPLSLLHAGRRLGVFVAFLDGDAADAPLPALARWMDLREAMQSLPAPWGETLTAIRERFVARSPDEALRVR
jgi:hypothetical protein